MNLSARYDIEAPVDFVYRELTDFDAWERMARRRDAEVTRQTDLKAPPPGLAWQVSFRFRGKTRNARLHLSALTPTRHLAVGADSKVVSGNLTFDLLDLAASRTRVEVRMEVRPKTLAARIYLQTLKLARKKLDAGFAQRVAQFAVEMEDRYRSPSSRQL